MCLCAPVVRNKRETAAKSFAGLMRASVLHDATFGFVRIAQNQRTRRWIDSDRVAAPRRCGA